MKFTEIHKDKLVFFIVTWLISGDKTDLISIYPLDSRSPRSIALSHKYKAHSTILKNKKSELRLSRFKK